MDGCRYSLREAHGWRVLYALRDARGGIAAYRPPDYWLHTRLGGDPDIVGRYRLQYDGLTPYWVWDRATAVGVTP